jgi:hypothetical protein
MCPTSSRIEYPLSPSQMFVEWQRAGNIRLCIRDSTMKCPTVLEM